MIHFHQIPVGKFDWKIAWFNFNPVNPKALFNPLTPKRD